MGAHAPGIAGARGGTRTCLVELLPTPITLDDSLRHHRDPVDLSLQSRPNIGDTA